MSRIVMPSPQRSPLRPLDELLITSIWIAQEQLTIYERAAKTGAPFDKEMIGCFMEIVDLLMKMKAKERDIDFEGMTDAELKQLITDLEAMLENRTEDRKVKSSDAPSAS